LKEQLFQAKHAGLNNASLIAVLKELQAKFVAAMVAVEEELALHIDVDESDESRGLNDDTHGGEDRAQYGSIPRVGPQSRDVNDDMMEDDELFGIDADYAAGPPQRSSGSGMRSQYGSSGLLAASV
jgi:hypothetical protein